MFGFRSTCWVGQENAGWRLMPQLNHGRVMLEPTGRIAGIYDRCTVGVEEAGRQWCDPFDHDDVRRLLGEIKAIWRISRLFNWQVAASGETIDIADAAAAKCFRPSG